MLAMATIGSARVLGRDRDIGSLVPGKRADIVAVQPAEGAPVDADPALAVLDPRAHVVASWVDGRQVLGADGPVLADTGSVNAAAREARTRIM
jgi:cytosine/adenosine deaminase-related metal-dependent hydrolase